ncbi:MAG: cation:proton antiporter [Thermoplasmatales archaeon]|nr:cation:proton antiporter [Candidatus Thermoplasmatota archaeon]MCL6002061.1 cation:proton antiporter [Candidatus Thermoplasmatota archaeon]MDA8054634.1 cation:proton antiporter [Thermoplasmatales archaeon]
MITTDELLLLLAGVMLLGFVGEIAFRKRRIPDMLLLLLIGILIHYSGLIPDVYISILRSLLSFVGIVALILIVFGGLLSLDLQKFGHSVSKGIWIAVADLGFVIGLMTPLLYYVFKFPLLESFLISTILSETAAPFIIPLLARIKMNEDVAHTIEVETIFNSVLNVIGALLILSIINQQTSLLSITGFLFGSISEAIVLGGVVGILWLIVLKQASAPHYYIATIAVLFVLWGFSDYIGASAILAVFIFSVIIANSLPISKIIKVSGTVDTSQLKFFNQEITFIVLTIFYVYIGILVNIFDFQALLLALIFTAVLVAIRFFEIYSVNGLTKWLGKDKLIVSSFLHRGPTVIVLLGIVLSSNPSIFSKFGNIIFYVVILTILAGSLGFSLISRRYTTSSAAVSPVPTEKAGTDIKQQ